jgi:hypothetical protein
MRRTREFLASTVRRSLRRGCLTFFSVLRAFAGNTTVFSDFGIPELQRLGY